MAGKNTSIALGAPYIEFARRKVESGEFGSTSEVVREAMRQYITQDAKLEALRQALIEGESSGPPVPWDVEAFLKAQRLDN